jgi:hypothetical protein
MVNPSKRAMPPHSPPPMDSTNHMNEERKKDYMQNSHQTYFRAGRSTVTITRVTHGWNVSSLVLTANDTGLRSRLAGDCVKPAAYKRMRLVISNVRLCGRKFYHPQVSLCRCHENAFCQKRKRRKLLPSVPSLP